MSDQKSQIAGSLDNEYKDAIQPVVDNTMRSDVLGPHFCRVLKEYTPASDCLIVLVAREITKDPELKKAITSVIEEHNKETKMKWFDRFLGAIGTLLLALVIWGVQRLIQGN
ncbi:MAG: hypothetical protein WC783_05705 [Candidatus Paceibacterota bacterium]|jgi:hypothetical protein